MPAKGHRQVSPHPKKKIGILAFGSLIGDPGKELMPKIIMRIKTPTPFKVEYGRYSWKTRAGAPTLVPHEQGASVDAEILVLGDAVSIENATDMLWRRERRKIGTGEKYANRAADNTVLVEQHLGNPRVSTVLYTDCPLKEKLTTLKADELARHAIGSVKSAKDGKDGISYLLNNLAAGIKTPLTSNYKAEILKQTKARSLQEALQKAKEL